MSPATFAHSRQHRALRAVNVRNVAWQGALWKLSRNSVWRMRYFVLSRDPAYADHFWYWPKRPHEMDDDAGSDAADAPKCVPSGGIALTGATVQIDRGAERQFSIVITGKNLSGENKIDKAFLFVVLHLSIRLLQN